MIFGSVCSGIEAASVAWHPLGWKAAFFSEIEKFPCAVLAHHYPDAPNYGDMTKFKEWPNARIDVLVGGTPCQSFSVAGLRKGLDDPRGNLTLTYLAVAAKYRPRWLVWENVPGVLSDGTGAFGSFLGGLAELGYGFAYRILDAQYFGVPQRRRRVFVVGHLGDWRRAAAVLFERESLQGNPAPRREAGQRPAPTISARTKGGGGLGTDFDCDGGLIHCPEIVPQAMSSKWSKGSSGPAGDEAANLIAHSLRADGFDASEDGTGRGTPLVPVAFHNRQDPDISGEVTHPIGAKDNGLAIAFSSKDHGADAGEVAPTLRSMNHSDSHANGGGQVAVAVALRGREGGATAELSEVPSALRASGGGGDKAHVLTSMQVRRLTPEECEALQGFPRGYTLIPFRNKPAADGPRYKALGNSFAVPVVRWIGERIQRVEELAQPSSSADARSA